MNIRNATGIRHNTIQSGYNFTRKADPYISNRLMHFLSPEKKTFYLDIGCGTGTYTIDLNAKGLKFYGIDPSGKMLEEAMFKSQKIKWLQSSAEAISVENKLFSGAIATLSIHQWLDFAASFAEVNRVLKLKSKFVIFTALPEQMENYWLREYFPKMMQQSIKQMPSMNLITQAMRHTGFKLVTTERYFIQNDLKDLFLYSGKNHPTIYLDENVRKGIPSFSTFSDAEEVHQGLKQLSLDLVNGKFTSVRQRYNDTSGDYVFIVMEKVG